MSHDMEAGVWRKMFCCSLVHVGDGLTGVDLWRYVPLAGFVYQHEESGWFYVPTCLGGSVPLWGDSSSGVLGFLAEAPDFSVLGDVIWPGRSTFSRHIVIDVLLKTARKIYFPLPGRRSASSDELRPPAAMKTGRSLQGRVCNFLFFQGGPCNICAVTTFIFM
ncbi:unnamed protein product [Urochloa humidicola]